MKEYFEHIIVPYINKKRENLKFVKTIQPYSITLKLSALKICLHFYVHVVLIPAICIDKLQPLNLSVNKADKDFLKSKLQSWYAQEICSVTRTRRKKAC